MVKRYHESFPSFSYGFDSRYPLQEDAVARYSQNIAIMPVMPMEKLSGST